ncbi:hypothetical protein [Altererythrobacter sp. ZODW24]|uniref:DUF4139 domain-containing protein n=1 Tax=Altererythrobacter sp. ZODW24 TaxID=2185142 RepID=UPI000DF77091|nr:hypothetical protein [Altererythrobacter sp. ZODW24]
MLRAAFLSALALLGGATQPAMAQAREAVDATAAADLSVTVYRDPNRGEGDQMNTRWPRGFAMISETRTVTLPTGESTVRFEGVAEGMVAVSAIVTGLPQGTIEKNRNADLLSPGALVDGTLGNRITITRTNPATGQAKSESAIVRTRADGGLVLQTSQGFEAVRCSGLPEKLTFPNVPTGLSAKPVFSINTRDDTGGTYQVVLTYLAWGFDWQAHYVATLQEGKRGEELRMNLMSWLTILNDNGQSFEDADLMAVAGAINIESDFQGLSNPPTASPLRLTCFPIGSTAAGSPYAVPPPPPAPMQVPVARELAEMSGDAIMVTASRRSELGKAAPAMIASEENLGDLKLYRIPLPVTVASKGLKQVAFLNKQDVKGDYLYTTSCDPWGSEYYDSDLDEEAPSIAASMLLTTVNDKEHGLGVALPMGGITIFEPSSYGDQLVGEQQLRDYASGQDVEIELGQSSQVYAACSRTTEAEFDDEPRKFAKMQTVMTNANPDPVNVRLDLGWSSDWEIKGLRRTRVKDGKHVAEFTIPANGTRKIKWKIRSIDAD